MKSSETQLKSRGFVDDEELKKYMGMSKEALIDFLSSKDATQRTIAARLLVKPKENGMDHKINVEPSMNASVDTSLDAYVDTSLDANVLEALVSQLVVEKKLYTKIALSESVSEFGQAASSCLVRYLGKVGDNQYKALPDEPFNKWSYPLPRDIICRTICKIGVPALPSLQKCLHTGSYEQILEALDAIGYISFYTGDATCQTDILNVLELYKNDALMTWKVLRALQAFDTVETMQVLKHYANSNIKQHRWEATRSMEQIQKRALKK